MTDQNEKEMKEILAIAKDILTEQWKKGELPSGEYYIIDDLGLHTTDKYYPSHGFGTELPQSVLGRVPSYEEWQEIEKRSWLVPEFDNEIDELNDTIEELQEENTKLKELLKECREPLEVLAEKRNACDWYPEDLLAKINQALGEDK